MDNAVRDLLKVRPKPLKLNSRELELSRNEDYRTVESERKDLVIDTTAEGHWDHWTNDRDNLGCY